MNESFNGSRSPADAVEFDEESGVDFARLVSIFLENIRLILAICLVFLILGAVVAFVLEPKYRADGMMQVQDQGGGSRMLKDLEPLLGDQTTADAEIEIINSRLVLGKVVEKLKLDTEVIPLYFSPLGAAIARRHSGDEPAESVLGLNSYSWGGDNISVDDFVAPSQGADATYIITVDSQTTYSVYDEADRLLIKGEVGKRAKAGSYEVFISQIRARPGVRFKLVRYTFENAVNNIRSSMTVREKAKKSGIIEVAFVGTDLERVTAVLSEVQNAYVRQNVEQRSEEAQKTLKFLDQQLPLVKRALDMAEDAYNSYRQTRGSLDLTQETQGVLKSVVEVENQIVSVKQEKDEQRQYFTQEHPRIQAIDAKLQKLTQRRSEFEKQINNLPDTQQVVLRLSREVEVNNNLYTSLLNTAQQLKVTKAGTVGDVRIIDLASASNIPVSFRPALVIAMFGLFGLAASVIAIFTLRSLQHTIDDPDTLEREIGHPVYATIPRSKAEQVLSKRGGKANAVLAVQSPEDPAVESFRSLRTTIYFALMDGVQNTLLISGPSPGIGKSFVSVNLGAVLANSGKRVVLVDADMRRGHVHLSFNEKRQSGLSDYLTGRLPYENLVRKTNIEGLSYISTGAIPPNPSELLMHGEFQVLVNRLCGDFDVVIFDAPPVLAASDAVLISKHVQAVLLVARCGKHPGAELKQAVRRFEQSGVKVKGFVFNDLDIERQKYRYGYKGYVYSYSYSSKS